MILFKRVEIDLEKERARINTVFTGRQRKVLLKLVDLFEQGDWQACLDHIRNKRNFPYNDKGEYDEKEHIGMEIGDILRDVAHFNYYTVAQVIRDYKKLKIIS